MQAKIHFQSGFTHLKSGSKFDLNFFYKPSFILEQKCSWPGMRHSRPTVNHSLRPGKQLHHFLMTCQPFAPSFLWGRRRRRKMKKTKQIRGTANIFKENGRKNVVLFPSWFTHDPLNLALWFGRGVSFEQKQPWLENTKIKPLYISQNKNCLKIYGLSKQQQQQQHMTKSYRKSSTVHLWSYNVLLTATSTMVRLAPLPPSRKANVWSAITSCYYRDIYWSQK